MTKTLRLTENELIRLVKQIISEHEEGDDVIIRYSDSDCEVEMKGILKQKPIGKMEEYFSFFTPIENGFHSSCNMSEYNPNAEKHISRLERNYYNSIGEDLLIKNMGGLEYGPDSNKFGEHSMIAIEKLFPVSMDLSITKY